MLETLKSLSDSTRLRLTAILSRGEFTVQDLTEILSMGQSRISRHLKILADVGIIRVKRQGTWGYYTVGNKNPLFTAMWPSLEPHLNSLPERSDDLLGIARVLEKRRKRSQEFFDGHAMQWDRLSHEVLPTASYEKEIISAVPSCRSLLEVGVGTGALLAELCGKAEKIVGVDHSAAMLEQAGRRVEREKLQDVELRLGDMAHLPLGDASVEVVLLNMVLHHAAQPPAVLNEIRRVLAPNGLLIIADLQGHDQEWVREKMADQWLGFQRAELHRWLGEAGLFPKEAKMISGKAGEMNVFIQCAFKGCL